MKFHEDIIFKNEGNQYGQELIELINIKGKIVKVHQTEYSVIDPKMYKPDLVLELKDKIIILEFQSTNVDVKDKRRFRFYTALFDLIKIKSKKPIEIHVLSTAEIEKTKWYNINKESVFPIYIHTLKNYDGEKFLNMIKSKIESREEFTNKELLMISLVCFMKNENDVEHNILDSAITITQIKYLEKDIAQFAKGVVLLLCDKFVKDELMNMTITNLVGGNMKNVEDYAQRKVDEKSKKIINNLDKEGFTISDIARITDVNLEFVKKALSKQS